MPIYNYICSKCGMKFESIESISHRNDAKHCPGCDGPASRDVATELAGLGNVDETMKERTRYSRSMGVNPEQIKEAEKNFPGSKYLPDGRLIINSRQHKLYEMKRRNMEELN